MDIGSLVIAILIGMLQGIFEWLPISSEGNIAIILTAMGRAPSVAVQYSLFLHLGTAVAATVYFREDIWELVVDLPLLRTTGYDTSEHTFLILATLISGVTGLLVYAFLIEAVSALQGGVLIVVIGVLLVGTGLFQRLTAAKTHSTRRRPTILDAVLTGLGQGLAILPGVSRSGTTVGVLLLRGHSGNDSFRLSFLLSIPASIGAAVLVLADESGLTLAPLDAGAALLASAIVGYLSIEVLMRVAARIAFDLICLVLGVLAIVGGGVTLL